MKLTYKDTIYQVEKKENGVYRLINEQKNEEFTLTDREYNTLKEECDLMNQSSIDVMEDSMNQEESLVSFYNNMIEFNPFQYKPYLKLIKNDKQAIYIADEVGVGKTFETGIIISELIYSNRISLQDNILIICPNMLCNKWQMILHFFFGLSSKVITRIEDLSNLSIISFDSISRCKELSKLDKKIGLLIIDEAHNVKKTRHQKVLNIRKQAQYTVLLSATPLSGKNEEHEIQKKLLFGKENGEFSFEKENDYLNRTLKDEMRNGNVKLNIKNVRIKNQLLEDYINVCKQIFESRTKLRRYAGLNMISSSPAAAKAYIHHLTKLKSEDVKRLFLLANIENEEVEEYGCENIEEFWNLVEDDPTVIQEIRDEDIEEITEDIMGQLQGLSMKTYGADNKLESLKKIIEDHKQKFERNEEGKGQFYKKIVVFVNYNETAHYLHDKISNSILINGELSMEEKWRRFNTFKDMNSDEDVLIITNVACEGQDMDFCNTIVNYDLTYNPVQLAQRIGRIDRFEIKKTNLFVYNFSVENIDPDEQEIKTSIDQKRDLAYPNSIYTVLLRKINEIYEKTGIYYNIIDNCGKTRVGNQQEAQKQVFELFKELYSGLKDFNSIQRLYDAKHKEKYKIVNKLLASQKITIRYKKNDTDKILIEVDKSNKDILRHIFDGGTLVSHLIYNNKALGGMK